MASEVQKSQKTFHSYTKSAFQIIQHPSTRGRYQSVRSTFARTRFEDGHFEKTYGDVVTSLSEGISYTIPRLFFPCTGQN